MKTLLSLLTATLFVAQALSQPVAADTFNVKTLNAYAIQEDDQTILRILDTLPPARLSPYGRDYKERFLQRFVTGTENTALPDADSFLVRVLAVYHRYWRTVLLKEKATETADSLLRADLANLLSSEPGRPVRSAGDTAGEPFSGLAAALANRGYFSYADEKTGNLFDLFVWRTQDTAFYRVRLTEGTLRVPVYFMKSIATLGWIEFASLGNSTPGGWPKNGALYCVSKSYDTTSEKFRVSFLQHEAQHFWDKQTYGPLPSWRLEYRAKLAELATADDTREDLLHTFTTMAKRDSTLPHPFGDYLITRNLAAFVFATGGPVPVDAWKTVGRTKLQAAARTLLRRDSRSLAAGRKQ